jgi:hypothetical protein
VHDGCFAILSRGRDDLFCSLLHFEDAWNRRLMCFGCPVSVRAPSGFLLR